MTSELPPKPRSGGSGAFIVAAIFMLLATGGLAVWKMLKSGSTSPTPTTAARDNYEPPRPPPPPPPPPPPLEEEPAPPASVSEQPGSPSKAVRGAGGCSGTCKGSTTPSLNSALASRGAAGRRCYEKVLLRDPTLSGRMKVRMRVGPGGQICSASIASDGIGDAGLSNCILGIFRSSTFPSPRDGCIDVEVPLSFVPQKR